MTWILWLVSSQEITCIDCIAGLAGFLFASGSLGQASRNAVESGETLAA
jgi:hypothetical protein